MSANFHQMISEHFKLSDFIECGDTYKKINISNVPQEEDSIEAIIALTKHILEPVAQEIGEIQLTYGLATQSLLSHIHRRIAPRYDQHAAHELNSRGNRICTRDGFAVDFKVDGENSLTIAKYIAANLPFDRIYFYGADRPLHVSYGPDHSRKICVMTYNATRDQWYPRNSTIEKFLKHSE